MRILIFFIMGYLITGCDGSYGVAEETSEYNVSGDSSKYNISEYEYEREECTIVKISPYLYIRTTWSPTVDLVQRILTDRADSWNNNVVNFYNTYLVPNTNGNTASDLIAGTLIHTNTDDACPTGFEESFAGANHGWDDNLNVTTTHDKTVADVGSEWVDESGRKFYIIRVVDATHLWMLSENIGAGDIWEFDSSIDGNLTHSANATHTAQITVDSYASAQLQPAIKDRTVSIMLNGATAITTDGVHTGYFVDVNEVYTIVDLPSALDSIIASVGSATQPDVNNGDDAITNTIKYQFQAHGQCLITHDWGTSKEIDLGYMGFTQSSVLTIGTYDKVFHYMPNTTTINDGVKDWTFKDIEDYTDAPAATLNFTDTYWEDPLIVPYRSIQYLGDTDEKKRVAFTICYSPQLSFDRINTVNRAWTIFTSRKSYPHGIDYKLGNVAADTDYQGKVARCYFNPELITNTGLSWWYEGDDVIMVIDYHETVTNDLITMPEELTTMTITVLESDNMTINDTVINTDGLSVTVTDGYGYAILKLT